MKARTLLCGLALCTLGAVAQTEVSPYVPGATVEGVTYYLPRTALRLVVVAEKQVYTPGEFSKYADRYLRLSQINQEPYTKWSIKSIDMVPYGVPDPQKVYSIQLKKRTVAPLVGLTSEGILLSINTDGEEEPLPAVPKGNDAPKRLNPRDYMNQEILSAGSNAKIAELTAEEIYDIRDSRTALIKGEADNMPKDGAQLKLMLDQLTMQETALTQLFKGTVDTSTEVFTIELTPAEFTDRMVLFRFSEKLGVVDNDDLSGEPVYLSLKNMNTLPQPVVDEKAARKKGKIGLFQQAAGGTIFLDEIGDISPKMQTKLLRVIQERQIMRVGGNRIIPVDVRIIAATNRNLKKMIKENEFRKDLYYRLHEGYVHLPSLAARREDIPMLIEYWQKELFASDKKISKDGMRLLMKHDWPGNVRELQNLVKFAFAVCENDIITARDLPFLNEVFEDTKLYAEEETLAEISENLSLPDRISMAVLIAAAELRQDGKLVGRSNIMKHLRGHEDQDVKNVSEYRVRKCLDQLQKEGYLIREGGYGLKMSDKAEGVLIQK